MMMIFFVSADDVGLGLDFRAQLLPLPILACNSRRAVIWSSSVGRESKKSEERRRRASPARSRGC